MDILIFALMHLKRMLKNRSVIILSLLLPTVAASAVAYFTRESSSNSTVYFDVVCLDKGSFGKELLSSLKSDKSYSIGTPSLNEANDRVKNNISAFTLIIPENFSKDIKNNDTPEIKIDKLDSTNIDSSISNKVNSFISKKLIYQKNSNSSQSPSIVTNKKLIQNKDGSSQSTVPMLISISFMMYTMMFIVTEVFALKKNLTLKRSLSTPNSYVKIFSSLILSFLTIGWIQIFLVIASTKILSNYNWGNSYVSLFMIYTSLFLVVLTAGLLISNLIKKESLAPAIVNMVVTITCSIGSFTPEEYLPDILKKLSYFTPQRWAVSAVTNVVLHDGSIISILPSVGIILLFAAAFFTASYCTKKNVYE